MGTEIELNAGIARLKADLSEFTSAVKKLADAAIGASEKEQARVAIKEMVTEVRKTFDTIVDTLAPLYGLAIESQFAAQFAANYASFKSLYLKRSDLARTHCHVIAAQFEALQQRRAWMANLPLAERAYANLKRICDEWLMSDASIVGQMEYFFRTLNKFMDEIASLNRANPTQGFQALAGHLKDVENNFLDIKSQLGELDALSRKL
jgi:hypothetical protein